jgi:HK97 gp10 family phage protein
LRFQIQVQQRGLDIGIFADRLESETVPGLVEAAVDYAYADMMSRAPVRTGRLLGSIQKQSAGLSGSVGPTVPYAVYVEYGTLPHDIRPVNASVLAFAVGGKMVFTPIVHHPGTRPNPFIEQTVEDVKAKIPELWQELFQEATQT